MTRRVSLARPGVDRGTNAVPGRYVPLRSFLACRRGATAIEYGLIAALVALAISGAVFALGTDLRDLFLGVGSEVRDAAGTEDRADPEEPDGNTNGGFVIIRPGGNVTRQ